jgi:hypothetical protein
MDELGDNKSSKKVPWIITNGYIKLFTSWFYFLFVQPTRQSQEEGEEDENEEVSILLYFKF